MLLFLVQVVLGIGLFLIWWWIGAHVWHALELPTFNRDEDLPVGAVLGHTHWQPQKVWRALVVPDEGADYRCARCGQWIPVHLFSRTVCRVRQF